MKPLRQALAAFGSSAPQGAPLALGGVREMSVRRGGTSSALMARCATSSAKLARLARVRVASRARAVACKAKDASEELLVLDEEELLAKYETHEVLKGETLYAIARKYETTVDELLALNALVPGDPVPVGLDIFVPRRPRVAPAWRRAFRRSRRASASESTAVGENKQQGERRDQKAHISAQVKPSPPPLRAVNSVLLHVSDGGMPLRVFAAAAVAALLRMVVVQARKRAEERLAREEQRRNLEEAEARRQLARWSKALANDRQNTERVVAQHDVDIDDDVDDEALPSARDIQEHDSKLTKDLQARYERFLRSGARADTSQLSTPYDDISRP